MYDFRELNDVLGDIHCEAAMSEPRIPKILEDAKRALDIVYGFEYDPETLGSVTDADFERR